MKKSTRRIVWLAAILLVGGMLASTPVNRARADTLTPLMTLDSTGLSATLDSQTVISGQDVVTNWTDASGNTFTVAGPEGTVLTLGTDSDGVPYAKVSPPLISTSADFTGDQAIAQYNASGLSLYQDALAVGFSSTDAQQLDDENNDGLIISHICVFTHWAGATTHECDVQHLLQHSGSKDWYIGNATTATATAAGHNGLFWFRTYVMHASHQLIDWAPASTISLGTCRNLAVTAAAPNGNHVSVSQNVCPDSLSPFFPGISGFGAVWQTSHATCAGFQQHDPSAEVESDTGGAATDNYSLWVKAKWFVGVC